jgi:YD repeat-containing protein
MHRARIRLTIVLTSVCLLFSQVAVTAAKGPATPAPTATPSPIAPPAPSAPVLATERPGPSRTASPQPTASPIPTPTPARTSTPDPTATPTLAPGTKTTVSPATLQAGSSIVMPYASAGYRYKVVAYGADAGFESTSYDDVAGGFSNGTAGFGNSGCSPPWSTNWNGLNDILLRKHLSLPAGTTNVTVWVAIDNDVQVFWNGTDVSGGLITHAGCATYDALSFNVPANLLTSGDNLLAARGRNVDSGSPQFIDLKVTAVLPGVPGSQTYGTGSGTYGNDPSRLEAEPVNTATGNYVNQVTDLALPGRGLPLAAGRTYNSLDATSGPLGPGWSFSYAAHLTVNPDGSVTFSAEDGAQYLFVPDGSGGFVRPTATYTDLAQLGDGSYQLTRRDGVVDHFDATGHWLSETDRNGNALTFSYSSGQLTGITDSVGRSVTLSYDGSGRLTGLAAPLSRSVSYTYDASGRLATVTDLAGATTTYGYDASNRLTTITDANGHVVVTNEYGADGRVSAQTDANGNRSTFGWDAASGTATYTDPAGQAWTDVYAGNALQSHTDPLGHATSYTYDANFNRASVTDPNGHTTTFTLRPSCPAV